MWNVSSPELRPRRASTSLDRSSRERSKPVALAGNKRQDAMVQTTLLVVAVKRPDGTAYLTYSELKEDGRHI